LEAMFLQRELLRHWICSWNLKKKGVLGLKLTKQEFLLQNGIFKMPNNKNKKTNMKF